MSAQNRIVSKLAAWCISELVAKLSRIFVVIVIARFLGVEEIGLAASALAVSDIIKSLTQNGIGQMVIAAHPNDLDERAMTAHWLFRIWSGILFLLQLFIAAGCYAFGADLWLCAFIALLGLEYLIMIPGLVPAALAMRDNKIKAMAAVAGGQVVLSNLLTVAICLIWPNALAMILPRLLTAPLWVIAVKRLRPWIPVGTRGTIKPFVDYGKTIIAISVTEALRLHADRLVVGLMLGHEALGIYFMAFNAGLSLSNAFSVAFAKVLFPHFCAHEDRNTALRHSISLSLIIIAPLVLLQSWLAPYYVPLLLGSEWAEISSIVSVLCLVAIPTVMWTASANWLRANGQPRLELIVTIALTLGMLVNTLSCAHLGIMAIAIGYLSITATIMIGASITALASARRTANVRV